MASRPMYQHASTDGRSAALLSHFVAAGYRSVQPAVLQPAEPFLDLSGEDIRRRMFLTSDENGAELCLRPDITIPVCRDYLASPEAGAEAAYCYHGPVFRQGRASAEFEQAGIESLGRRDTAAADADIVALALDGARCFRDTAPDLRMGDVGLFAALLDALPLPASWKRRLVRDFNRPNVLARDLAARAQPSASPSEYRGVLSALAGSDPRAAHALVADLLSIAGINAVGGRSVDEIADRFLEQAALAEAESLPDEIRLVIQRFLDVQGSPEPAAQRLRTLADDAQIAMGAALDLFDARVAALKQRNVDLAAIRFQTAFGRGLDYYTGLVFELHDATGRIPSPLIAGGRYDGLLSRLGSSEPIPAIGFSAWIARLVQWGDGA